MQAEIAALSPTAATSPVAVEALEVNTSPPGRTPSRRISVVLPTGGADEPRMVRELSSAHCITPQRAQPAAILELLAGSDGSDDAHPEPEPEPEPEREEAVRLHATRLEADALRKELSTPPRPSPANHASEVLQPESPLASAERLFEAFVIVGAGVGLAQRIKDACAWWKPSNMLHSESEYDKLCADNPAELLCLYPPSTDAARSLMFQQFCLPDAETFPPLVAMASLSEVDNLS